MSRFRMASAVWKGWAWQAAVYLIMAVLASPIFAIACETRVVPTAGVVALVVAASFVGSIPAIAIIARREYNFMRDLEAL